MHPVRTIPFLLAGATIVGCAHVPPGAEASVEVRRTVSFPAVTLKTDAGERIESLDVVMHCGRFIAINHIPDDWSAQVTGPSSEVTTLRMEAGHGSSALWRTSDLDGFITVLYDPSCFDITASIVTSYDDGKTHDRKFSFKRSDLDLEPLPNKHLQPTPR